MSTRNGSVEEYNKLWDTMRVLSAWENRVSIAVAKVRIMEDQYRKVDAATSVPWRVVGLIHLMESDCSKWANLLNGERWNKKTELYPAGHGPWSCWLEAAIYAMHYEKMDKWMDWSTGGTLKRLEMYNGGGYLHKGVNSPYLWSGSNHGIGCGKYIEVKKDGKYISQYKPDAVSEQIGAAIVLKGLL